MIKKTSNDFIEMPWKNGGGITTELFRREINGDLKFRLSKASISSDGPFSLFPGMDRWICLLKGNGFTLNSSSFQNIFTPALKWFQFPGELEVSCSLISGECQDFNVMADRSYASCSVQSFSDGINNPFVLSNETFLYLPDSHELHILQKGEIVPVMAGTIIVITVLLK